MEDMKRLPMRTLFLWIFRALAICSVAVGLLMGSKLFLLAKICAITAGMVLIYLPLFLFSYKFGNSDKCLYIEYGIIFRTAYIIPFDKIIYVKLINTPVLRGLGLSMVIIKAIKAVLFLPEILSSSAEAITATVISECQKEE